jgi:hypothetical protein
MSDMWEIFGTIYVPIAIILVLDLVKGTSWLP